MICLIETVLLSERKNDNITPKMFAYLDSWRGLISWNLRVAWPLHLIKHVPDQYLVVPIPMSLAACSPLYFLNLFDLKFRIMIGTKFISGAPLDKAMQWKVTQL